jgi:putative ABC transport system permease protein
MGTALRVCNLALINVIAFRRRFIGLAILVILGTAICLCTLSISGNAERAARQRVSEGTTLRSVEIERTNDRPNGNTITPQKLAEIRAISSVTAVEPAVQATFGIKTSSIPGALLYGTLLRPSQSPPIVKSVRPNVFPLTGREAVLPAKAQDMDLTPLLGQSVSIAYQQTIGKGQGQGAQDSITVVGFFDPSWQFDGPDSAYVAEGPLVRWAAAKAGVPVDTFLTTAGYDKATVLARSSTDVPGLLTALQAKGYLTTSFQQRLEALPGVLKLLKFAGRFLFVLMVIFVLIGAVALSGALVRQRTREIGLLKAVGYRDSSVLAVFLCEIGLVGLVSTILGFLVGVGGGVILNRILLTDPGLSPYLNSGSGLPSLLLSITICIVPVATIVGTLLPARRGARMEPSVALRDW